jgi:serine/threonine-protein kinase
VPFRGATHEEIAREKAQDVYHPAREFAPEIPPALDRILRRALALDIRFRYQSAEEFAADLESTGIGRPITAARLPRPAAEMGQGGTKPPDYPTQPNLSATADTAEAPRVPDPAPLPPGPARATVLGAKVGLAVASFRLSGAVVLSPGHKSGVAGTPRAEPIESVGWMPLKPVLPQ